MQPYSSPSRWAAWREGSPQISLVNGRWSTLQRQAHHHHHHSVIGFRALPGAVFTLTHTAVPPLLMMHKDAQYRWIPSSPTMTISQGALGKPAAVGFLQLQADGRFEGELASSGGCWMHLSLQESEDGSILAGLANINTRISTRSCKGLLAKEVKKGEPFPYALVRPK